MKETCRTGRVRYESNVGKFFLFLLTDRRHYMTILSVYFLTLPDTHVQQIGVYTAAGMIASFLLEMPSGYLSDRIGHKRTLILSKCSLLLSTVLFLTAESVALFTLGSIFLATGFALSSGTATAFLHNTLVALKREDEYVRIKSKISANVSMLSAVLSVALPLFTMVSMTLPLQITLFLDALGLAMALLFVSPPQYFAEHPPLSLRATLQTGMRPGFYPLVLFTGASVGFVVAESGFRYVYLEAIGYPVALLGVVLGASRVLWFAVGHSIHRLERIPFNRILAFDTFFFPLAYAAAALLQHPYIGGALFSLILGYHWGRRELYISALLRTVRNPNYKATVLSIEGQAQQVLGGGIAFAIGFLMQRSYPLGYLTFAAALLLILLASRAWMGKTETRPRPHAHT